MFDRSVFGNARSGFLGLALVMGVAALTGCALRPEPVVVVATPSAISIRGIQGFEPDDIAAAHCAKHGRKSIARGGIPLGHPSYAMLYGYDCVK